MRYLGFLLDVLVHTNLLQWSRVKPIDVVSQALEALLKCLLVMFRHLLPDCTVLSWVFFGTTNSDTTPPHPPSTVPRRPPYSFRSRYVFFLRASVHTMATPGARAVLRLPRAGAFPRLRSAEAARQAGRRSVAGVAIARRQQSSSVQVLRDASAKGHWRRRGASGVGRDVGVLLPRQAARGLTSGVVSTVCFRVEAGRVCGLQQSRLHCFATALEVRRTCQRWVVGG